MCVCVRHDILSILEHQLQLLVLDAHKIPVVSVILTLILYTDGLYIYGGRVITLMIVELLSVTTYPFFEYM